MVEHLPNIHKALGCVKKKEFIMFIIMYLKSFWGWQIGLSVEHLPSEHEALNSYPRTAPSNFFG
jgi:hypothetical protein